MSGISQSELGVALGVTFQQIQKYEKGANRISASKLHEIGAMLGVPAAYFFIGVPMPDTPATGVVSTDHSEALMSFLATPEGERLAKAFCLIKNEPKRRRIIEFVQSLGGEPDFE